MLKVWGLILAGHQEDSETIEPLIGSDEDDSSNAN